MALNTELYDAEGKALGLAPTDPEQLKKILLSGKAGFLNGSEVNIVSPSGEVGAISGNADEVLKALQSGYRLESHEERKKRELQEDYGGAGNEALTVAHGIGNTLSFGALDAIGGATSDEYKNYVKNLKEANPTSELLGSVVGILGPIIATGGAGAAGEAGALKTILGFGKAGAGIRGVAKIGKAAETTALKLLGGAEGGLVRRALAKGAAMAAGAGAEGTIYGAGQWLGDAGLGETDASAESLLAHMGNGALWGAAAGGALGAGGTLIKGGVHAGVNLGKRTANGILSMYEHAFGKIPEGARPGVLRTILRTATGRKGRLAADLMDAVTKGKSATSGAAEAAEKVSAREALIKDYAGMASHVDDAVTNLGDEVASKGTINATVHGGDTLGAAVDLTGVLDDSISKLDDILENGVASGTPAELLQARKILFEERASISKILKKAGKKGGEKIGEKLFEATDKIDKGLSNINQPDVSSIRDAFNTHIKNVNFYGKPANVVGNISNLRKQAIEGTLGDEGTLRNFLDNVGKAENKGAEDLFAANIDNRISYLDALKTNYKGLPKEVAERLNAARNAAKLLKANYEKAYNELAQHNIAGDIIKKMLPIAAGAGAGYAWDGKRGALEGAALGWGGGRAKITSVLEHVIAKEGVTTAKTLSAYLKRFGQAAAKVGRESAVPTSMKILQNSNWGEHRTTDKTRQDAFQKRSAELTHFVQNPQVVVDRLTKNVGPIAEVAPKLAQTMQIKSVTAAKYLYDHMPKSPNKNSFFAGKWKPSDIELSRFERIAAVVNDPKAALKSLGDGILTGEEVDALKNVWPEVYNTVVASLAEKLPALQTKLPYKEQVQLSILFDTPIHYTMEPQFLTAMAETNRPQQQATGQLPGAKQPKSKLSKFSKLNLDKTALSTTQRIEANKLA